MESIGGKWKNAVLAYIMRILSYLEVSIIMVATDSVFPDCEGYAMATKRCPMPARLIGVLMLSLLVLPNGQ